MRLILNQVRSVGLLVWALASAAAAQPDASSSDKFAYLIPQFGADATAWAAQQTAETRDKLEASPTFNAVLADMRSAHDSARPLPTYHLLDADRYLRIERDQSHPYGRIQISDAGPDGHPRRAWRTVFDLDAYNKTAAHNYSIKLLQPGKECLAPAFDRCMLPLTSDGGQNNEYVELDLNTGRLVSGGFHVDVGTNSVAWLDRNTLVIAHTTGGVRVTPSHRPTELYLWRRGQSLADAKKIFELDPHDSKFAFNVFGESEDKHIIVTEAKSYTRFQLKTVTQDGQADDIPLPESLNDFDIAEDYGAPRFTQNKVAVQLSSPASINGTTYPADSIVAFDLLTKRISLVMTPPKDVYLSGGFSATKQGLAIVGVHNLRRILYLATPDGAGWAIHERLKEPAGITLVAKSSGASAVILLSEQGVTVPPQVRRLTASGLVEVDKAKAEADLRGYKVDVGSARGADGVSVDYYLMHKKGSHGGPTPTILQGYGGFGMSDDPRYFCCYFGASWKSWFDRGGAFAIAAVRGGGERGGEWHQAGAGANKKTMFDDFNTVAEALERSGFTDAAHLGITGHSNGGLLTAGAVVLRPDLYGAAVISAPLTDLSIIGHGDGSVGAGMSSEFGSWDDPAQRRIMQTWDPYFNIKPGQTYPKTLVVVATTDNQVGPSHSRRFVAKMRDVGAPAMLLEGAEGGHDYPDEYTQTADTAMQMSFFIDALMKP
jgi:prolyl oligopeptidase